MVGSYMSYGEPTIALGHLDQERKRSPAGEIIRMLHQGLLYHIIPDQNHQALGAHIYCHHWTIPGTELHVRQDKTFQS